ncbi:MAG: hypothetical protein DSY70_04790 [Desulfobulbus sp.]|nr:MAG: hypothetical protein DSY70_04790 [Desulfobulbus sp.]
MDSSEITRELNPDLEEIKLFVPPDRYRAFQRCVWILVHETGRTQLEVMREVVEDFLIKHKC